MTAELDWIWTSGLHLSLIPDPNPFTWTRERGEGEEGTKHAAKIEILIMQHIIIPMYQSITTTSKL